VTASVKDQENTTASVTWTITVTTSGFIFVDAVNGHASSANGGTGTGTLANPFQTINDYYSGVMGGTSSATRGDTTYKDYFVYYRSGSYSLNTFFESDFNPCGRTAMIGYNKPMVHLAYPGESPVWNYNNCGSFIWYSGEDNLYIDGFEIKNMTNYGIQFESNGNNIVFRRLVMHDLISSDGSFNNQSFIRFLVAADFFTGGYASYLAFQDNTFYNLNHGSGIKVYSTNKLLVEDNLLYNFSDSWTGGDAIEGIALKGNQYRTEVRKNAYHDIPARGIGGNFGVYGGEIRFNLGYNASGNVMEVNQNNCAQNIYIYRNTMMGGMILWNSTSGLGSGCVFSPTGPYTFSDNVIVNNTSDNGTTIKDHISCGGGNEGGCTDLSKFITSNNLACSTSQGCVDSTGNLTSTYLSYLGRRGYQINGNLPAPPKNLAVK
jgi:hypothetical protein